MSEQGMNIEDATPDASIGGNELVPVSDAGAPKCVSISQIKDFTIARIAALAAAQGFSVNDDSVYILRGGELTRVSAETLAAAIMNEAFGRAAVASPNGNEVLAVKDATVRKTITFDALKNWLEANISVTPDLSLETAGTPGVLGDSDLTLVVQASGAKKATLATLKDYVLGKLAAFLTASTAAQSVTETDVVLLVQGGNVRKATVAQLIGSIDFGDVKAPTTTTQGNIPAWDSTAKKLTNGYAVSTTIASASPSNTKLATEKAVRDAITDAGGVSAPTTTTAGNIPSWDETNRKLTNGYAVKTEVGNTATAGDTALVTEKAVRQAVNETVRAPASHAEDAIPTWGAANELKAGKAVVTTIGSTGSDDNIPTEKAVRNALPVEATPTNAGLMPAADKVKLDGLVNTSAVEEIGGNTLSDADTIVVRVGDTTYKKAILPRIWAYISGKLSTFKIDRLAAGDDNTNLDSSTDRHGLLRKLDNDVTHFLRGDGTWAEPTGSADFTGTDGTADGVHGLVPKPLASDANKFLKADGTWAETPAAAGVDIPGKADIGEMANDDLLYAYQASTGSYKRATMEEIAAYVRSAPTYDTLFIPAGAMTPSMTDGATASALAFSGNTHDTVAFVGDAAKRVEINFSLPEDWDGGEIKAKVMWTCNAASAETGQRVRFGLGVRAFGDGKNITDAASVSEYVEDSLIAVNYNHISDASEAITVAGLNPAGGELLHATLMRDVANGTLGETVHVLGLLIQYRKDKVAAEW